MNYHLRINGVAGIKSDTIEPVMSQFARCLNAVLGQQSTDARKDVIELIDNVDKKHLIISRETKDIKDE